MISVQNLSLEFTSPSGTKQALSDLSFQIHDGEFVAIIGANGSGKTSLSRCLNGILTPTRGEVYIDGYSTRDRGHLLEIRRRVGLVFQNPDNQIISPTVEREIAFGLENLGIPRHEMRQRVAQMLQVFELETYRDHAPHLLSGGEKQRLALAAIVAMQPRHLIFDEPTSLLDYPSRLKFFATIDMLRQNRDHDSKTPITILHVTQFPEETLLAERLLVLREGKIIMDGPRDQVLAEINARTQKTEEAEAK